MRPRDALAGIFLGLVLSWGPIAAAKDPKGGAGDDYLRGYVVSWLEETMHRGPERVAVEVRDGIVTLTGTLDTPEEIERVAQAVGAFPGVVRVVNRLEVEEQGRRRRWRPWAQ